MIIDLFDMTNCYVHHICGMRPLESALSGPTLPVGEPMLAVTQPNTNFHYFTSFTTSFDIIFDTFESMPIPYYSFLLLQQRLWQRSIQFSSLLYVTIYYWLEAYPMPVYILLKKQKCVHVIFTAHAYHVLPLMHTHT